MSESGSYRLTAWVLSILLHAILIFVILYVPASIQPSVQDTASAAGQPAPTVNQPFFVDILTAPHATDNTGNKQADIVVDQTRLPDSRVCKDKSSTYMGVGLLYSETTLEVTHAPEYYPAYKSGIRVGDKLLNPHADIDSQGFITLYVLRFGKQITFRSKAEKICFTNKED